MHNFDEKSRKIAKTRFHGRIRIMHCDYPLKTTFSAVLFDLDGTLLDTIAGIADSMNHVLAVFGLPGHDAETYKKFVGEGMEKLVFRALPAESPLLRDLPGVVALYHEEYGRRWQETSAPYPGVMNMLAGLDRRGIRMAILSNKADDFTQVMVARLLPGIPFVRVRGARTGEPKKPDPRPAMEIADDLAVPAIRFVYLGDSGVDMNTAVAAGMYPVGVEWGFRSPDELRQNGAKLLLDKPEDIFRLF
jgi:phosphoglycolate phosphatase